MTEMFMKKVQNFLKLHCFCLISVGYHLELHISLTFYQHYRYLSTKLYYYSMCILATYVIWVKIDTQYNVIALCNSKW